jgi:hypothetical protein
MLEPVDGPWEAYLAEGVRMEEFRQGPRLPA